MFSFVKKLLDTNQKELSKLQIIVASISALEPKISKLKDEDFPARIANLQKKLKSGSGLDDILDEVFALTREAAQRTLSLRPYDVQIMAGITFHQGKITEQKTGEGKTLSAAPALVLNALSKKGAHLVTVNDYLARRDTGWMGPLFHFLGLSTGVIFSGEGSLPAAIYDPKHKDPSHADERLSHLRPVSRKEAYAADITYGTSNEFGFDYLRDNMARSNPEKIQREHHFAIVDEVDSILIDEARTPLIISAPDTEPTEKYYQFAKIVSDLSKETDYEVDEKMRTTNLTEHGLKKLEKILKIDNIYEKDFDTVHHTQQALKARNLFEKDKDYIVKDDQVIIVDEHTGRLMYGRRYSDGLHQAIEAKENAPIQQESKTLATISLQNFFRMYQKLSGMTGTAATEAEEFKKIYDLDVVVVPTHRPVTRIDHTDLVFKTTRAKYAALVTDIQERTSKGQPILIGTKSIEQNQVLVQLLKNKKVKHEVLNAKNHEQEASIISQAGRVGAVTVATNIAGRGVDIVLGGSKEGRTKTDWQKEHDKVVKLGGLHVIGAVRHESRRIDNQFRGRSGRQGDPGSSRFYVSLEDDIMRIFGGEQVSKIMDFLKVPEDQPLEAGMVSKAIETAQSKVESFHFDQRKSVVDYDDVVNKQREIFYGRRNNFLNLGETNPEELHDKIYDILEGEVDNITAVLAPAGITPEENNTLIQNFATIIPLDTSSQNQLKKFLGKTDNAEEINNYLQDILEKAYTAREKQVGKETLSQIERLVALGSMDQLWIEHLDALDDLRDGIGLRSYAQKDPLVEYKQEAFSMFESLLNRISYHIAQRILRVQVRAPQPNLLDHATTHKATATSPGTPDQPKSNNRQIKPVSKKSNLGRNDPCWCGSGKKFKKCHYPNLS